MSSQSSAGARGAAPLPEDVIATLRRGEHVAGLRMARALADARPGEAEAHRLLSLALSLNGETAAAHTELDRALLLAPQDGGLHYQRAVLFLAQNRTEDAQAHLQRSTGVDPNELRAYVLQAQLALAQADLDEAERLSKLAARVDPSHPWVLTTQGLVLLHRGRLDEAHPLLARAAEAAPDEVQPRYALGLALMARGAWAFAEEAFRRVLARNPRAHGVRFLLADALRRQDRLGDAADALEAGGAVDAAMPPDLLRFAGELRLVGGDHARALPVLKRAAAAQPEDRATLDALIEALRRQGDPEDARHTLEAAIARAPHVEGLWSARLSFEPADGDIPGLAERWAQAIPRSAHPLHVRMWDAARRGDAPAALDLAYRIVEIEPGHLEAQTQIIDQLYLHDPAAAVAHIESLLPNVQDPMVMRRVLSWLARAQDRAGRYGDAARSWERLDAIPDPQAQPLPPASGDAGALPAAAPVAAGAGRPVFLYGPPGSGVERIVAVLAHSAGDRLRRDRFGATPPHDPLQYPSTAARLADGTLDPAAVAEAWRAGLPARDAQADPIDWLPWWDNALLRVLRGGLPEATLWLVLCDPRDMLLDWLQRGTYVHYAVESHEAIAAWLAGLLEQLADVVERAPVPLRVLRLGLDGERETDPDDPAALARLVGDALDQPFAPPPDLGAGRYPSGHWRHYAQALAGPFARLAAVAKRLGYPEA